MGTVAEPSNTNRVPLDTNFGFIDDVLKPIAIAGVARAVNSINPPPANTPPMAQGPNTKAVGGADSQVRNSKPANLADREYDRDMFNTFSWGNASVGIAIFIFGLLILGFAARK